MTNTAFGATRRRAAQRLLAVVAALTLLLSGFSALSSAPSAAAQTAQIPYGNVIVVLQDGLDPSAFASASGVQPGFVYGTLLTGFSANLTEAAARRLAQVPQVLGIYPDNPVSAAAQVIPTGVERINAPRNPFFPFGSGSGVTVPGTVAVVDSGVAGLSDLNLVDGYNCTSSNIEDYGDVFGHGTHVAGILGAKDNNDGVVGVAPGVGIFSARMLDAAGTGNQSELICALEAVSWHNDIRVANLSLTTNDANPGVCGGTASALHRAVCSLVDQGTVVVVAAGNVGAPVAGTMAAYPEVVAVSAFQDFDGKPGGLAASLCTSGDVDDTFWASSNRGPEVDIMAPGVCIRSYNPAGGQAYRSGTSLAAPHVSGALALYFASWGGDSAAEARASLLGSAAVSQAGAGVGGAPFGEPVLMLGPAPGITPTATPPHAATRTVTVTPTPPDGLGPGVVGRVRTRLNLRAAPSLQAEVLGVLATNTQVLVTGYPRSEGAYTFIPVTTPIGRGWIATGYTTAIGTATATVTPSVSPTATSTPTASSTSTATSTPSNTPTASTTPTATNTPTNTTTPTPTTTPSNTPTASSTSTPSNTPTSTNTPTQTNTPTVTNTPNATNTPTPPSGLGPGVVGRVTTRLNMRSEPSTGNNVVTVLPTDTLVTVTGYSVTADGYVFIPVSTPYGNGWVVASYVTPVGTATPTRTPTASRTPITPGAPTNTPTRTPTRTATVPGGIAIGSTVRTTTSVNMRTGPGTGYGVVTVLSTNSVGTVLAGPTSANGYQWYRLNMGSAGTGWVASNFFTVISGPGPTATATRTPSRTATVPSGGIAIGSTVRTTTSVNMRSGAGTNFGVVALLPTNASGTVLAGPSSGSGYQWYRIAVPGYGTGWVASDYLAVTSGPVATATRTATTTNGFPAGSTVRFTDDVNFRSGPGTGYAVIGLIPSGTDCTVLSGPTSANGYRWYRLDCGGFGIGYAVDDWLTQVSAASLPDVTVTPIPIETDVAPTATEATSSPAPTETSEPATQLPAPEATEAPTEAASTADQSLASPAVEEPAQLAPTELPPTATGPQSIPIARVQRSDGSSPGQVLVDDDPSTVWSTDGSSAVPLAAFVADLDSVQYVSSISWLSDSAGLTGTLHISVSTDNETWTDLPLDNLAPPGEWQELMVDANVRYIRFVFVNDEGFASVGGVAELRVWP
jgi:uncharacterized protein YgiM (DUF1202 family)